MSRIWKAGRFDLTWQPNQPLVMGIVNATPDSFSDGGQYAQAKPAIAHAERLLKEGADVLDLGGESTRPGSEGVSVEEEWARVQGILAEVVKWNVPLSIDTLKPEIMRRALDLGVDIVNDVNGFRAEGAMQALLASHAGAVVMHMQGQPRSMQISPEYDDVVAQVRAFLKSQLEQFVASGFSADRVLVDPGFGFGKTLAHNMDLIQNLDAFSSLGAGVLVGVSRKRMIGELTGQDDPAKRVSGSIAAALFAAHAGAAMVRVHDVRETCDALAVWKELHCAHGDDGLN